MKSCIRLLWRIREEMTIRTGGGKEYRRVDLSFPNSLHGHLYDWITRLRYAHAETHKRVESENMKRADRYVVYSTRLKAYKSGGQAAHKGEGHCREDNPESDYRNLKQTYVTN